MGTFLLVRHIELAATAKLLSVELGGLHASYIRARVVMHRSLALGFQA